MFTAKQFRVTVHLDNFFKDHRRESRIFIKKSTKTIADLENHIKQVFNVNDFFLSCQNCFLPPAEDVRILQEDETVWVWPKPASEPTNNKNPKISAVVESDSDSSTSAYSDAKVTTNKSKKLKTNGADLTSSKKETQITNGSNKSKILKNKSDDDEEDEDEDDDTSSEETDDNMQSQTQETIQTLNTPQFKDVEMMKHLINDNVESNNTRSRDDSLGRSSVRSFKVMSSIGALMDSLKTSAIQSDDSFVNKNRRRRVRKRKRSSKVVNGCSSSVETTTVLETTIPVETPNVEIKSPAVHLRFSDAETANTEVKSVEIPPEAPLYNYSVLSDDDFLKYPVMQNTLPRTGDVISFKVLKIGDSYNPEVSKYIVAKVINYNATNSMVNFKILYGIKELVDPQGKFYIKTEDKDAVNTKEMKWSLLITPRLLFP